MRERTQHSWRDDEGFGLVEAVVALFVLAILSVALLPLLIQALQISAENTTRATATQLVNQQMELVQAAGPACSDVTTSVLAVTERTDPRGVTIRVQTTFGTCPVAAGTMSVRAIATRLDTGAELVRADTLVFVVP